LLSPEKASIFLHSRAQLSTAKTRATSCQLFPPGLLSLQIEPVSLKNSPAQSKEGARTARFQRPQFFGRYPRYFRLRWRIARRLCPPGSLQYLLTIELPHAVEFRSFSGHANSGVYPGGPHAFLHGEHNLHGPSSHMFNNLIYGAAPIAPLLFPNLMVFGLIAIWQLHRVEDRPPAPMPAL